ncbi:MAG: hypothetical protein JXB33_00170 [Clostridia bacterium]|nr:hypothetical protein [Clostridia bacterium]
MDEKMTREQAFEILQIDPSTPTDKVKIKYENFMRRAKFDDTLDDRLITKAYDTIMGIDWGNFEPDEAYAKKGINKKKIENFFYLYKRNLAYGAVVLVMVTVILLLIFTGRVKYDYQITLIGSLNISDQEVMADYYEELLGVENVMIDYILIQTDSADGALTGESMNKLFGDLNGGDSDLFIVNPEFAKFLSYDGALLDMTPYLADMGIAADDPDLLRWYKEGNGEIAAAYKFGNQSIFNSGTTGRVPEYFCMPYQAEFSDKTAAVVKDLIEQNKGTE